ncbi:beta-2-glycoprotein 1-like [Sycon ciliatum]|uniref:beta-2-glycoprotein 1-like n=1 Tax=Sycon ciliatum TaxID=27933 RepID=UPI0031F60418
MLHGGNGKWDDVDCNAEKPFICQRAVMCHVTPPKFGNASSRFVHYPDSVQYTCDTGYWLDGPTTANCTSDGTLTTTPKCKVTSCDVIPPVHGSASSLSIHYPDSVVYTCDTGYSLDGPTTANCTSDGTLTATPQCKNLDFECEGQRFKVAVNLTRTSFRKAQRFCRQNEMKLLRTRLHEKFTQCSSYMDVLGRAAVDTVWMRTVRTRSRSTPSIMYDIISRELTSVPDATATFAFICTRRV